MQSDIPALTGPSPSTSLVVVASVQASGSTGMFILCVLQYLKMPCKGAASSERASVCARACALPRGDTLTPTTRRGRVVTRRGRVAGRGRWGGACALPVYVWVYVLACAHGRSLLRLCLPFYPFSPVYHYGVLGRTPAPRQMGERSKAKAVAAWPPTQWVSPSRPPAPSRALSRRRPSFTVSRNQQNAHCHVPEHPRPHFVDPTNLPALPYHYYGGVVAAFPRPRLVFPLPALRHRKQRAAVHRGAGGGGEEWRHSLSRVPSVSDHVHHGLCAQRLLYHGCVRCGEWLPLDGYKRTGDCVRKLCECCTCEVSFGGQ